MDFHEAARLWRSRGFNSIPVDINKRPMVSGWGDKGTRRHTFGDPLWTDEEIAAMPRESAGCAVFPASGECTVIDVDDPTLVPLVLNYLGNTDVRTFSPRKGGGVHLWYRGVCSSRNSVMPGVDVKSTGGYAIVGPSAHRNGTYETVWGDPPPAANASGRLSALRPEFSVVMPNTAHLKAVISRLPNHLRGPAKLASEGKPFAKKGERDTVIFQLIAALAEIWPNAAREGIDLLFSESLGQMGPDAPDAGEKWERIKPAVDENFAKDRAKNALKVREAWSWVGKQSEQVLPAKNPLVVTMDRNIFVSIGSDWAGPWTADDLNSGSMALSALYGIQLPNTPVDIIREHGVRSADIRMQFYGESSYKDNTLRVRCAPFSPGLTPLPADEAEPVTQWLAAWGGEPLLQWMAGLLRLERPLRALILSGPANRGKSMFLSALARIWKDPPCELTALFSGRYSDIKAPLAIADDVDAEVPIVGKLRDAVSRRRQWLTQKYKSPVAIDGCMRFVLASNDPAQLFTNSRVRLSREAALAFLERICHIRVAKTDLPDPSWLVEGNGLARWALYWHQANIDDPLNEDRFMSGPADRSLDCYALMPTDMQRAVLFKMALPDSLGVEATDTHYRITDYSMFLACWDSKPRGLTEDRLHDIVTGFSDDQGVPRELADAYRLR